MDGVLRGLRPYTSTDLPQLVKLLAEARAWPPSSEPTEDDVRLRWRRRSVNPETDVSILPDPGGKLVAFGQTVRQGHGVPRLNFEIAVLPEFRQQGIGGAMYNLVEECARSGGISHITSPLYVAPQEMRLDSAGFLERRGFRVDSSYWQMRVDDIGRQAPPRWPPGIECRSFGEIEPDATKWARIVRESFNEHATAEGIAQQLSEEGVSRHGYFFAVDANTGVEVGTSRARIDYVNARRMGYIGTVGVLPAYRGRGIAEALIRQTLLYLAEQGIQSATLFVENANTVARKLYDNMGWRQAYRTDHYWKRLQQHTDTLRTQL